MRYTLTNRAIAILLSIVMIIGSASTFAPREYDENCFETNGDINKSMNIIGTDQPNPNDFAEDGESGDVGEKGEPSDGWSVTPLIEEEDSEGKEVVEASDDDTIDENDIEQFLSIISDTEVSSLAGHSIDVYVASGFGTLYVEIDGEWKDADEVENIVTVPNEGTLKLWADPDEGWAVSSWSGGGITGTAELQTISHITSDMEVSVRFIRASYYITFWTTEGSAPLGGSITQPDGFTLTGGVYRRNAVLANAEITFLATHNPGFLIGNWEARTNTSSTTGTWSVMQTGGNSYKCQNRSGDTDIRVSFLEGYDVSHSVLPTGIVTDTMIASYRLGLGSAVTLEEDDAAPWGADVTFSFPPPPYSSINVLDYEWYVNGEKQEGENDRTFTYSNLQRDIDVELKLVQGFTVDFDPAIVSATYSGGIIIPARNPPATIIREDSIIAFTALQDTGVYEYQWNAAGTATKQLYTLPDAGKITRELEGDITAELEIVKGYTVQFGTVDPLKSGTVTAEHSFDGSSSWTGITSSVTTLYPEESRIRFFIEPAEAFRATAISWIPLDIGTQSKTTYDGDTYTINNLSSDIDVKAVFIDFSLDNSVVWVRGQSSASIDFPVINATGTATGIMELKPADISALPPGLSVRIDPSNGNRILIDSNTLLTEAANENSPYTVHVTRAGVERTLIIHVALPVFKVEGLNVINITNSTPSGSIVFETNTSGTLSFDPALPAGLTPSITPLAGPLENRSQMTISGILPGINDPAIIFPTQTVNVWRDGIRAEITLTVTLTPPPRIDSITPAAPSAFTDINRLGISTETNAIFNVTGVNFATNPLVVNQTGVNELLVIASLSHAIDYTPPPTDWITAGTPVIIINSNTSATVTIPLIVAENNAADGAKRSGTVTVSTNLGNSTGASTTPLIVSQFGRLTLDPKKVEVTEHNNAAHPIIINVTGLGKITHVRIDTDDGVFETNVHISYDEDDIYENRIIITTTRPDEDIFGKEFTITFFRDGLDATLIIEVNILSLDPVDVEWPEGFSATFGDLLSSDELIPSDSNEEGIPSRSLPPRTGYATFTDEDAPPIRVPGVFSWAVLTPSPGASSTLVGNAPSASHSMIFTPIESDKFASDEESISINIGKTDPTTVTHPGNLTLTFGETLSQALDPILNPHTLGSAAFGSLAITGIFTFHLEDGDPTTFEPTVAESGNYTMIFTPTGTNESTGDLAANFNTVTISEVYVTVRQAPQDKPDPPEEDAKTATSITLKTIPDAPHAEFGRSGENGAAPIIWQETDPVFTGLAPYTEYNFYVRLPGDENRLPSDVSDAEKIQTGLASLEGTPLIIVVQDNEGTEVEPTAGNIRYRDVLKVDVSGLFADPPGESNPDGHNVLRSFTYQWKRNGADITETDATNPTYTLTEHDLGATITVTVGTANTTLATRQTSAPTATVTQRPPVRADLNYAPSAADFTGSPLSTTVTSAVPGMGEITVQYFYDNDWRTAPTNAGVYPVRAVIALGITYTEGTILLNDGPFTINKIVPDETDLTVTLPSDPTEWNGAQHNATVTSKYSDNDDWIGAITIFYHLEGDIASRKDTAPSAPGTYIVTVNITEGINFNAITDFLEVGSFTIEGTPITSGISIQAVDTAIPATAPIDIGIIYGTTEFPEAKGAFDNVFDGINRKIVVKDDVYSSSVIQYWSDISGQWSPTPPQVRNVVHSGTIKYRVIRPSDTTGYDPLYGEITINITQRQLVWDRGSEGNRAIVTDRQYDGTDVASIPSQTAPTLSIGGLNGIVFPDNVTVAPGTANFSQINASEVSLVVTGSGWSITGANAGNYYPPVSQPLFDNAIINQRQLSWLIGSLTNRAITEDKIYDRLTTATFTAPSTPTLDGVISGDTVTVVPGSLDFSQFSVGSNLTVTASGWDIIDTSGNYLTPVTEPHFTNANITHRQLTWDRGSDLNRATVVQPRVYNGNTTTTVDIAPTLSISGVGETTGIIPADVGNVNVVVGSASFANSSAGTHTVTGTGWGAEGSAAGNYLVPPAQPLFANADITGMSLSGSTVTVSGTYTYTGAPIIPPLEAVTVNLSGFGNLVPGEDFTISTVTNNEDTGSQAVLIVTGSGNFTDTATGNFTISPRPLSGTANINVSDLVDGRITDTTTLTVDHSKVIGVQGGADVESLTDITFQWYRDGQELSGETNISYIIGSRLGDPDPVRSNITVKVIGIGNYTGFVESRSVVVGLLSLGGKIGIISSDLPPTTGDSLEIDWEEQVADGATYTIRWLRNGIVITGATSELYTIIQADLGKTLTVEVVGTGDFTGFLSAFMIIPAVIPDAPFNLNETPGDGQVTLEWNAPFNGGSEIIKYQVSTDGFSTSVDVGLSTSYTVTRLTDDTDDLENGTEYTFWVRAVNIVGDGDSAEIVSTPEVPLIVIPPEIPPSIEPYIISIIPTPETSTIFGNVPEEGIVEQAVFDVTGVNLTEQALLGLNIFSIFEFPAWTLPSNLNVEYINSEQAIIVITLSVFPNTDDARSGNVNIHNTITASKTGTLYISQEAASETFQVIILNTPNGETVITGQSESVREFEPGELVSLIAGARDGFEFNGWSTSSPGVVLDDVNSSGTSFIMPENDVIIIAVWTELELEPPDGSPDGPPSDLNPPDTDEDTGNTPEEGNGNGQGVESGIGSGDESDPGDLTGPEPGGDPVIGGPSPPNNESKESGAGTGIGFGIWLMNNLWWIWLSIGAVTVGSTLSIMNYRKKKKKRAAIKAIDST